MEIFPAIDLKGGEVVRLTQGDYDRVEIYSSSPAKIASDFLAQGASNLHVVDLDGARDGEMTNLPAISEIAKTKGLFIEVGGGIRDEARVNRYLELGVGRIILGTVAIEKPDFTREMAKKYGAKIAVGVDAREGKVATRGWRETTTVDSMVFCRELEAAGVQTIIYTDISRDGAMQGTNLEVYKILKEQISLNIIASGGISSIDDVKGLLQIGVEGAILGKALYIGALDLKEVLRLC